MGGCCTRRPRLRGPTDDMTAFQVQCLMRKPCVRRWVLALGVLFQCHITFAQVAEVARLQVASPELLRVPLRFTGRAVRSRGSVPLAANRSSAPAGAWRVRPFQAAIAASALAPPW